MFHSIGKKLGLIVGSLASMQYTNDSFDEGKLSVLGFFNNLLAA